MMRNFKITNYKKKRNYVLKDLCLPDKLLYVTKFRDEAI